MRNPFIFTLIALLFPMSLLSADLKVENGCYLNGKILRDFHSLGKDKFVDCRVIVENTYPFFLRNVKVKVTLPRRAEFVSGTDSPVVRTVGSCKFVVWTISHFAPEEKRVFKYRLKFVR